MRALFCLFLAVVMCLGCGSTFNVDAGLGPDPSTPGSTGGALPGPFAARNQGTQVWFAPAPASDLIPAIQHPELWSQALSRIDVFMLYWIETYYHEGFECGTPCGPNTYPALMAAVPGGAYKWLSDRFLLAIEAGGVKEQSCTAEGMKNQLATFMVGLDRIHEAGGKLTYVAVDESFTFGVTPPTYMETYKSYFGCGITPAEVAQLLKLYVDTIHAKYPHVQVGFVEPYPALTVDELMSYMGELERAGVPIPFLQIDMHLQGAVFEKSDPYRDFPRLKEFCKAKNIPLNVIIWGQNGTSNREFSIDAWTTLRMANRAIGITSQTKFQSWAESSPGDALSLKFRPGIITDDHGALVGESDPETHAGQVIRQLEYLGVQPTMSK